MIQWPLHYMALSLPHPSGFEGDSKTLRALENTQGLMMLETSWRLLFSLLKALEDLGSRYSAFFLGQVQTAKQEQLIKPSASC